MEIKQNKVEIQQAYFTSVKKETENWSTVTLEDKRGGSRFQ